MAQDRSVLTGKERTAYRAGLELAAHIIEVITLDDVTAAQAFLIAEGEKLEQVCQLDRAKLAWTHIKMLLDHPEEVAVCLKKLEEGERSNGPSAE